jgi:hypothetical protein
MTNNEMNHFETIISSIRNILRVEGITGLDSINHCIALLVSRYLTIDKCNEFNIPLEFFLCPASFKFFISQPVLKIFHYFLE